MKRCAGLVLFAFLSCLRMPAQNGTPDQVFAEVPFEEWLAQPERPSMKWSADLSSPELSAHQRLMVQLFAQVDRGTVSQRAGKGQLELLLELTGSDGQRWQTHKMLALDRAPEAARSDVTFSERFFVLPGNYRVSLALYDTATREHSIITRRLHVAPLKNDPLPDAWRDLPDVQFVPEERGPDGWLLPMIRKKLRLLVETHEPVHVHVIVNLTPSAKLEGSSHVQARNMGALLPAAKVLSQVEWRNGEFSVAMLDLSRQRVAWQQDVTRRASWWQASHSLGDVNPGIIDVKSLENRNHSAAFFLGEIRRRIWNSPDRPGRALPVLIVLSPKVEFDPGQETDPAILHDAPNARVYYIRYQPPPVIPFGPTLIEARQRVRIINGEIRHRNFAPVTDQLAPLLKPLEPRLFDVETPEQFRKAIAVILDEIAHL